MVTKHDVPEFGPVLPRGGVLKRGPKLRDWILAKLINAENACYKSKIFSSLDKKTR